MAEVTDNAAVEYVECAAYFSIVSGGLLKAGSEQAAQSYKSSAVSAFERSVMLAMKSRSQDMASKVTIARLDNLLADMWQTIGNNYSNIALLSSKYSESCLFAMTDASSVLNRWLEKISSRYLKPPKK